MSEDAWVEALLRRATERIEGRPLTSEEAEALHREAQEFCFEAAYEREQEEDTK